jgi:phage tail sheath gpL-like
MTIPFKQIPSNLRTPLFYAELDNSQANTANGTQRTLIIGQITSSGTATPGVPVISQGVADAAAAGGTRSVLAAMTKAYRAVDTIGEVWYLPLADDGAATAAAGSIVFTAVPTSAGTLSVYVAGTRYQLPVTASMTTTAMATALYQLIAADLTAPVIATNATAGTVTLTAANKGPLGNDIDIRLNYGGALAGEATPAGLAVTITAMSGGATAPSLSTPLANLGDKGFDFIVCPYRDTTTLDALKAFLNDTAGRWSWTSQIYGHVFTLHQGTLSALTTLGDARNDQHASIVGMGSSPTPAYVAAAIIGAACANSLRADPAMPLQTVTLPGLLAPAQAARFVLTDRNTLLNNGIGTITVADDGTCALENVITTYQLNGFGEPDNSYLEVETMFTLAAVLRRLKTAVTSKFARVKLAANGTRYAPGSGIVTPNVIRAELIAEYRAMQDDGLVQGADEFAANLIVQQNATNPNRVDVLYPAILIDQLRQLAVLMQFRNQV